jgi:hypothetical protein
MIIAIGNHLINMANVSHITLRDMSGNVRIEFIGGGTFTLSRPDSEWFQAWMSPRPGRRGDRPISGRSHGTSRTITTSNDPAGNTHHQRNT